MGIRKSRIHRRQHSNHHRLIQGRKKSPQPDNDQNYGRRRRAADTESKHKPQKSLEWPDKDDRMGLL